jgi:hypothetical protein
VVRRLWLAAAVAMLAACGQNQVPGDRVEPGPPVWVEPACPKPDPNQPMVISPGMSATRGRIPDDFATAWVLRCGLQGRSERADASVGGLVDLLRRPSDPRAGDGTVCPAHYLERPYVALVNAEGKAILPEIPTDKCSQPRQEVLDFLNAMSFHLIQ